MITIPRNFFFFIFLCLWLTDALVQEFDAFDRKIFKKLKQRYALFDPKGILTLDATVNGKTNDITYMNTERNEQKKELCMKDPTILMQLCETQKLRAWTKAAICYESQLSMPELNPFFHLQPVSEYKRLVKVVCGERQNAIIVERIGMKRDGEGELIPVMAEADNASQRYDPYYAISTTFAPEKYFFQMPDKRTEKQCVLLQFGSSQGMRHFNITSLRHEPRPVYTLGPRLRFPAVPDLNFSMPRFPFAVPSVIGQRLMPKNLAEPADSAFPDMENRNTEFDRIRDIRFLFLDLNPRYFREQNISVYGWLPVEIKITGQTVNPCYIYWEFIQSRHVTGSSKMIASTLQLEYKVTTGTEQGSEQQDKNTTGLQTNQQQEYGGEFQGGVNIPIPYTQGMVNVGFQVGHSFANTWGSQQDTEHFAQTTKELSSVTSTERVEKITFYNVHGQINVEQMVLVCNGAKIKPDRIRYVDPYGEEQTPDEKVSAQVPNGANDYDDTAAQVADAINPPEDCFDEVQQCPVWASQGECHSANGTVYMLTRCKKSCGTCKRVGVKAKNTPQLEDRFLK